MALFFSFIIPVYNRPEEIKELLESLEQLQYHDPYEIVIVEDGSTIDSKAVIEEFSPRLPVTYFYKENTGPGDSRNFGMKKAKGNYFIILDSDCLLPPHYLDAVSKSLSESYVDFYGGPDTAHESFSMKQRAINYAMTSVWTTGGIRGGKKSSARFQPRSFNMGLAKAAFEASGGFGDIHPGEDPDLSLRLWKLGFTSSLLPEAFVYHKRRVHFKQYLKQVKKFGLVRPILNAWHPGSSKFTYWFPTFFLLGLVMTVFLWFLLPSPYNYVLPLVYLVYFLVLLTDALINTKNFSISVLAMLAVLIQFSGYGYGFLKSTILVTFSNRKPQELFPELFFKRV